LKPLPKEYRFLGVTRNPARVALIRYLHRRREENDACRLCWSGAKIKEDLGVFAVTLEASLSAHTTSTPTIQYELKVSMAVLYYLFLLWYSI
jgi:hypothetical protein